MNRGPARLTHGEIVETLARILVMAHACIEIGAVGLALDQRSQLLQRVLHISNQAQIDRSATADLIAEPIHLNDLHVLWVELLIGEVRSQHEQSVTVHHGVIARRKTKQPGHPYVIWIVVLDKFLAPQRMENRRLQPLRRCNQFRVSAFAARTAKNGDLACAVQNLSRVVKFVLRWKKERGGTFDAERKRRRGTVVDLLVDLIGIEPMTSSMPSLR